MSEIENSRKSIQNKQQSNTFVQNLILLKFVSIEIQLFMKCNLETLIVL